MRSSPAARGCIGPCDSAPRCTVKAGSGPGGWQCRAVVGGFAPSVMGSTYSISAYGGGYIFHFGLISRDKSPLVLVAPVVQTVSTLCRVFQIFSQADVEVDTFDVFLCGDFFAPTPRQCGTSWALACEGGSASASVFRVHLI